MAVSKSRALLLSTAICPVPLIVKILSSLPAVMLNAVADVVLVETNGTPTLVPLVAFSAIEKL